MPARLIASAHPSVTPTPRTRSALTVLGLAASAVAILSFTGAGRAQAAPAVVDATSASLAAASVTTSVPPAKLAHPTAGAAVVQHAPLRRAVPAASSARSVSKVLAMAAKLRGRPYHYGSTGPRSFDCSGYTRFVFAHSVGRSLIHSSASQYAHSHKIAKSAIRPGDLVFYTHHGHVYHVGIYAGHGLIWDAPHTGLTVRLERIATSSWVAGRVL
jgi:cell wall-associated NlpC family hydrolase